ncbi:ribonuclease H2, subunit B [Aspergillus crustosus]
MRTRSAPPAEPPVSSDKQSQSQTKTTTESTTKPSKTFILPSAATPDARFVTLPHPRTGDPTRYFFCPKAGVYEFTVVASQFPRSVLYASTEGGTQKPQGQISKTAELLVATPIDILFFVIPLLTSLGSSNEGKRLFQPLDDIIDSHDELPKHLRFILYNGTYRETINRRVEAVCDSAGTGDEKMFRVNETKLLQELLTKAERVVAQGLPKSLEERFVKQTLAAPLLSVTRTDIATSNTSPSSPTKDEMEPESQESKDTHSTTTTSEPPPLDVSTPIASTPSPPTPAEEILPEQQNCPDSIVHLQRLSTALTFLKSSYIPSDISTKLDTLLASTENENTIDFAPLHAHLKHLADLRAEALASRSLGDFSRKRNAEDDDAAESRAEKKRRIEEEEKKKKAGQSKGVRDLKKVNTTGMKKMSDFFGKAAAKKKS